MCSIKRRTTSNRRPGRETCEAGCHACEAAGWQSCPPKGSSTGLRSAPVRIVPFPTVGSRCRAGRMLVQHRRKERCGAGRALATHHGAASERAGHGGRTPVHCQAFSRPGPPRSRVDGGQGVGDGALGRVAHAGRVRVVCRHRVNKRAAQDNFLRHAITGGYRSHAPLPDVFKSRAQLLEHVFTDLLP